MYRLRQITKNNKASVNSPMALKKCLHSKNASSARHNFSIRFSDTKLEEYVEDKDEDMESRGSGFVVLNDATQACISYREWNYGGGHA